ncbi:MAG: VWA domain-containing protein [Bryobacterales bacterium]|nr:VWA domain-containing protein [Bryobacterales bacterium]
MLPTRVETKAGETVYGLTADQFIVEDNGVRKLVRVEENPESTSISLVIAIQCGRSAAEEFGKLKGLATMIDAIVGAAPHEVAVVVYGERPWLLSDFSDRSETTRTALSRLKSCGDYHAASIDAVSYSLNLLRRRSNRYRRAILLIGEQRDHGSVSKLPEVVTELGTTDTVIYSVAFSPTKSQFLRELRYGPNGSPKSDPPIVYPTPRAAVTGKDVPLPSEQIEGPHYTDHAPRFQIPPLLMLAINALRANTASEIATLSGGEHLSFVTASGLEKALHRISNQIHNHYLLSFQPTSTVKPASHAIRVRVIGRPDAVIQTRKSYWSGVQ